MKSFSTRSIAQRFSLFCAFACLVFNTAAQAQDAAPGASRAISYKLTTGLYQSKGGGLDHVTGLDINLRATGDFGNAWVGWFRAPAQEVSQARVGWDRTYSVGAVRLVPSLQAAQGGFWGGSLSAETGDTWFAGVGLGRTNLRSYANLNFDPNDAWTLSGGYRWADNRSLAVQLVRDNRLNPDQQHLHLVYRTPVNVNQRLTLDVLHKTGFVAGLPIRRLGVSVGYDWPSYFVRVAYDPQVNFTAQDMLRVSVGGRF